MQAPADSGAPEVASGISPGRRLLGVLQGTRPHQWSKNLLLLAALLFSQQYQQLDSTLAALAGLALFVLASGSLYLLNDVADVERDRQHPDKRRRPVAAGVVSIRLALAVGGGGTVVAVALGWLLDWPFGLALATYVVLQFAYSWFLKHLVIIDLLTIASGFVLRAVAGALVIGVAISPWLYLCTFLLALFLGVNKRWAELLALDRPDGHRPVLRHYSPDFLRALTTVATTNVLMAYAFYTFSAENLPSNHAMMLTIPIVLYGLLRYLYLVYGQGRGQAPERLLYRDPGILISVVAWGGLSLAVLQFAG